MPRRCSDALVVDMLLHEREARLQGFQTVVGIDEVGRGPLAGPVVAAAVILPHIPSLQDVRDSKKLSAPKREMLYRKIHSRALCIGMGLVEPWEIDDVNILQATFQAMLHAVGELRVAPDFLLIDGPYRLPIDVAQKGIPQGDQKSLSIAAASIVAKVHRDALMARYHTLYPLYGFDRNKGYGTTEHLEAIRRHGPCPIHRMSFKGVRH
jgi:ribonuclease HII